ncbi:MAG: glycoside hydrolase family 55 protein [Prolixibacteraceae bacterium]|nr:glycoside hydrolase family 55 protein [Prolixibacteraceae bacterium]
MNNTTGKYLNIMLKILITFFILVGAFQLNARPSHIVKTLYPTEDVVVADWDVTTVEFGADNTGMKDATVAIQAAIDSCYSHNGGTVWMPAGTYKISRTLEVRNFVTLRGDWRDPDIGSGSYGTILSAQLPAGEEGPVLLKIGYSAGVMGLTIFYPNQNAVHPIPYNYTFYIEGWVMCPAVINCTMINSFRGLGVNALNYKNAIEVGTFKNIKGTALFRGVVAGNASDVSTWENINFSGKYWAKAGKKYNCPTLSQLRDYTLQNGIAFTFGDLEWDQFYKIGCSGYKIGIQFVKGSRISFCGIFYNAQIDGCKTAVEANQLDPRWGAAFLRSTLQGIDYAVNNKSIGYLKVTDCKLSGEIFGNVRVSTHGSVKTYQEAALPKVSRLVLYNCEDVPHTIPGSTIPTEDATSAIQQILDRAGSDGGGVVYLPAGWYKICSHLTVPANVELRGCSSIPSLDGKQSYGTVLMGYEGANTPDPDGTVALVTLNGNRSGISGLRFFYPENNPAKEIKPYPFAIRGKGDRQYIVNIGMIGVFNGIDLATNQCNNHLIRKVIGTIYHNGIVIGSGKGRIEGCLTNGAKVCRVGFNIPDWASENHVFKEIIDPITRPGEQLIVIKGSSDEQLLNNFAYGSQTGITIQSGKVNIFNFGTDNLAKEGNSLRIGGGEVKAMNVMRYNGSTVSGIIAGLYNEMYIGENDARRSTL